MGGVQVISWVFKDTHFWLAFSGYLSSMSRQRETRVRTAMSLFRVDRVPRFSALQIAVHKAVGNP